MSRLKNQTRTRRTGFTLAELLVVISLIVLLIAVAVPSFSSLLYSQDRTLAENQLRVGLAAARDAAVRSRTGVDSVAAFYYVPETGRIRIVPCLSAGVMKDVVNQRTNQEVEREVFVPVPTESPLELPRGWTVRGYAPPGSVDQQGTSSGWYDGGTYNSTGGHWIFPENAFCDLSNAGDGKDRQSFVVRFEGGTGSIAIDRTEEVLVVDLSPNYGFRETGIPWAGYRLDRAEDLGAEVRRLLIERPDFSDSRGQRNLRQLLGDEAIDTVLARPLGQFALADERRVATGIGARGVNKSTLCLYGAADGSMPVDPTFDTSMYATAPTPGQIVKSIDEYIEGRRINVVSEARIFTLDRYSGQLRELEP
jgi:prepilin-type N-terminal cleavage/methylation domain-containing protein